MAESVSDFSKILELQEIQRLYEESSERHGAELSARDEEIAQLREELQRLASRTGMDGDEVQTLRQENERLHKQVKLVRQEYDVKIERLNARVRELSAGGPTQGQEPAERRGFFRR